MYSLFSTFSKPVICVAKCIKANPYTSANVGG